MMFSFTVDTEIHAAYLKVEPESIYPFSFSHEQSRDSVICDVDSQGNLMGVELLGGQLHLGDLLASYPNISAAPDPSVWRELSAMIDPVDVDRLIRRLASGPADMQLSIEYGRPSTLNFSVHRPAVQEEEM